MYMYLPQLQDFLSQSWVRDSSVVVCHFDCDSLLRDCGLVVTALRWLDGPEGMQRLVIRPLRRVMKPTHVRMHNLKHAC